jgi:hypothetical protein
MDFQVRKLFRSMSPEHSRKKMSPKKFKQKIYPKFNSFLKNKQKKRTDALAKKEEELFKKTQQLQYSKMWKKRVKCENPKSFLKRNEDNIRSLRKRQEKNAKLKLKNEEESVNSCSFHPAIHKSSKALSSRSINDWYGWDRKKEQKRLDRLQKRNEEELKKCMGRFRSPVKRLKKNKSVHLNQR